MIINVPWIKRLFQRGFCAAGNTIQSRRRGVGANIFESAGGTPLEMLFMIWRRKVVVVSLVLPVFIHGCAKLGAVGYFLAPEQTVEAEFTLPKGPLMILVDDSRGKVIPPIACNRLTDTLARLLRENAGIERITTSEEINRLRQAEPRFEDLSIREVGRLANADTMIWMSVRDFAFDQDLETAISSGRFAVVLKVFNIKAEEKENLRLWPAQPDGRLVEATIKSHEIRACKTAAQVHEKLADALADTIAKLFYRYRIEK